MHSGPAGGWDTHDVTSPGKNRRARGRISSPPTAEFPSLGCSSVRPLGVEGQGVGGRGRGGGRGTEIPGLLLTALLTSAAFMLHTFLQICRCVSSRGHAGPFCRPQGLITGGGCAPCSPRFLLRAHAIFFLSLRLKGSVVFYFCFFKPTSLGCLYGPLPQFCSVLWSMKA